MFGNLSLHFILDNTWGRIFVRRVMKYIVIIFNIYVRFIRIGFTINIVYSDSWKTSRHGLDNVIYGNGLALIIQILFINIQLGIVKEENS